MTEKHDHIWKVDCYEMKSSRHVEKTGTVFIRTCTLCGCAERLIIGFTEWRPFDPESNPLAPEFRGGEQPPDWFKEHPEQKQ